MDRETTLIVIACVLLVISNAINSHTTRPRK